ncbi:hypothetical protein GCM10011386_34960 [Parapedobacter defluvii]|uniref:KilA-N DNA-binding domain-containing protein n=1 Tax=Parapedobacter defluvii TaxID=2045106 RepID=A0ABQ1MMT1_9SPHI|nr:ORF6N domain-containing protein [Parapedobacter defluvii]GGC39892.1 hypothetical protein GCM10011386_34960 [Parapedobacter defluvii]
MSKTQNETIKKTVIPDEVVINKIYLVRDQKVMLDSDLAELYGVETKRLNEQVRRNMARFPEDFMFTLTRDEFENLKSQIATSSWGGRRKLPNAFTEHGVLMLSSVLNSERAIQVNIQIMRIYTKIREMLLAHKDVFLREEQVELISFMKPKNITAAQKRLFANCKILSIDMKNNGRDRADDSLKKFRIFILGFLW